jgi:hypothetical protein
MTTPKFSIICPHYQPSIPSNIFWRGMECLLNQTFTDFEVLVYHDGPKVRDDKFPNDSRFHFTYTEERKNDWGHSNRDRGIREAKGEYIIHFNPDNILYPNALSSLDLASKDKIQTVENNNIIIFAIWMKGMVSNGKFLTRTYDPNRSHLMIGYPPTKYNIDAMQLVMKKKSWLNFGGWYDKSESSDGNMYPRFVSSLGARYVYEVLGEHW